PKLDSTVRSEAARLRARLLDYYAGEGSTDPVRISLPKGGYIPLCQQLDVALRRPHTDHPAAGRCRAARDGLVGGLATIIGHHSGSAATPECESQPRR